jgi:hypothetical protein
VEALEAFFIKLEQDNLYHSDILISVEGHGVHSSTQALDNNKQSSSALFNTKLVYRVDYLASNINKPKETALTRITG